MEKTFYPKFDFLNLSVAEVEVEDLAEAAEPEEQQLPEEQPRPPLVCPSLERRRRLKSQQTTSHVSVEHIDFVNLLLVPLVLILFLLLLLLLSQL